LHEVGADARSKPFKIVGGPTLYKKEIVGVTLGTLLVMVLLIGTGVVGVKVWRRRRSQGVAL